MSVSVCVSVRSWEKEDEKKKKKECYAAVSYIELREKEVKVEAVITEKKEATTTTTTSATTTTTIKPIRKQKEVEPQRCRLAPGMNQRWNYGAGC